MKLKPYINQGPYIVLEDDNILQSYGICDLKLTKSEVDLDNIFIETNLNKKVSYLNSKTKIKLYYNENLMTREKKLGEGSYGKIYLYSFEDKSVVLKIPEKGISLDYETSIVKKYLPDVCRHHTIPFKVILDQNNNEFLIMQQANGDLDDLKLDDRLKLKLILTITKMLNCFYNKGIVYGDLKLENILYRCKNDKINIFLGDIGSFFKIGDYISEGYYIPPEALDNKNYIVNKEFLLYNLGSFIAEIYGLQKGLEYKNNTLSTFTKYRYPKIVKRITSSKIPKNIKALILALIHPNKNERAKFDLETVFYLIDSK